MTTEYIKAFTKRGGKIHKLPGFEYKPLPPRRSEPAKGKARQAKAPSPVIT